MFRQCGLLYLRPGATMGYLRDVTANIPDDARVELFNTEFTGNPLAPGGEQYIRFTWYSDTPPEELVQEPFGWWARLSEPVP